MVHNDVTDKQLITAISYNNKPSMHYYIEACVRYIATTLSPRRNFYPQCNDLITIMDIAWPSNNKHILK